jgi:hypothetical protein
MRTEHITEANKIQGEKVSSKPGKSPQKNDAKIPFISSHALAAPAFGGISMIQGSETDATLKAGTTTVLVFWVRIGAWCIGGRR